MNIFRTNDSEEESSLKRGFSKMKNKFFTILCLLIKYSPMSMTKLLIIYIIIFCQYLKFSFNDQMSEVWGDSIFKEIFESVANWTTLFPLLEDFSYTIHITIFYGTIGFIITIFGAFFVFYHLLITKSLSSTLAFKIFSRTVLGLITILYLPVIGILFSVANCDFLNGNSTMVIHPEIECTSISHIIHMVVAWISILFSLFGFFVLNLLYYNSETTKNDAFGRWNAHADVMEMFSKIIILTGSIFLQIEAFRLIMGLGIVISNFLIIMYHFNDLRFHSALTLMCWKSLVLLQFWSGFCLLLTMFIQEYIMDFTAGAELFVFGIPVLILYIFSLKDQNMKLLMKPISQILTINEAISQIFFFHLICHATHKLEDRRFKLLFNGYVQYHTRQCDGNDCPLILFKKKQYLFFQKSFRERKKILRGQKTILDAWSSDYSFLTNYVNSLFQRYLDKFPNVNRLRIIYTLFLFEQYKNLSYAILQVGILQNLNLSLENSFVVFCYKTSITEKLILNEKQMNLGETSLTNLMSYEEHFEKFNKKISQCTTSFINLWGILQEPCVDLNFLKNSGFLILKKINQIEKHWEIMIAIKPDDCNSLRIYTEFNQYVLNDKNISEQLLRRLDEIMGVDVGTRRLMSHMNYEEIDSYAIDGVPSLFVSGKLNFEGIISNCNLALCNLLGYEKNSLVGKHLDIILPKILKGTHQQLIRKASQTEIFKKEISVQFVHSNGYLMDGTVKLLAGPSLLNSTNFVGQIIPSKKTFTTYMGHFIIDKDLNINEISSSRTNSPILLGCIYLFGLSTHMVNSESIGIKEIIPDLQNLILNCKVLHSSGTITQCLIPQNQNNKNNSYTSREDLFGKTLEQRMHIIVRPIALSYFGHLGYYVQLEFPFSQMKKDRIFATSNEIVESFHFSFNELFHMYFREFSKEEINKAALIQCSRKTGICKPLIPEIETHSTDSFQESKSPQIPSELIDKIEAIKMNLGQNGNWSFFCKQVDNQLKKLIATQIKGNNIWDFDFLEILERRTFPYGQNINIFRKVNKKFFKVNNVAIAPSA